MNLHIREALIEDLELIQSFNTKLLSKEHHDFDPTVNQEFAQSDAGKKYLTTNITSESGLVLIAEYDNHPVGFLVCSIEQVSSYRTISQMCEIDNMWVDKAYRNQNIGKELFQTARKWSKQHGIKRMRVIASAQNTQAINFYKREGFEEYDLILEQDVS